MILRVSCVGGHAPRAVTSRVDVYSNFYESFFLGGGWRATHMSYHMPQMHAQKCVTSRHAQSPPHAISGGSPTACNLCSNGNVYRQVWALMAVRECQAW